MLGVGGLLVLAFGALSLSFAYCAATACLKPMQSHELKDDGNSKLVSKSLRLAQCFTTFGTVFYDVWPRLAEIAVALFKSDLHLFSAPSTS